MKFAESIVYIADTAIWIAPKHLVDVDIWK